MKPQTLVKALEETAQQLGVAVRRERGSFRGGPCVVAERPVIVLNKMHPPEVHLRVLAEALRDLPVESIYLRPAVRHALEDLWEQHGMEQDGMEQRAEEQVLVEEEMLDDA